MATIKRQTPRLFPVHKPDDDDCLGILIWHRYWRPRAPEDLEDGDIWRSMPAPPSDRLQELSEKKKAGEET